MAARRLLRGHEHLSTREMKVHLNDTEAYLNRMREYDRHSPEMKKAIAQLESAHRLDSQEIRATEELIEEVTRKPRKGDMGPFLDLERITAALQDGANPNLHIDPKTKQTIMHKLAESKAPNADMAIMLISAAGGDVNLQDIEGKTPLHSIPMRRDILDHDAVQRRAQAFVLGGADPSILAGSLKTHDVLDIALEKRGVKDPNERAKMVEEALGTTKKHAPKGEAFKNRRVGKPRNLK